MERKRCRFLPLFFFFVLFSYKYCARLPAFLVIGSPPHRWHVKSFRLGLGALLPITYVDGQTEFAEVTNDQRRSSFSILPIHEVAAAFSILEGCSARRMDRTRGGRPRRRPSDLSPPGKSAKQMPMSVMEGLSDEVRALHVYGVPRYWSAPPAAFGGRTDRKNSNSGRKVE